MSEINETGYEQFEQLVIFQLANEYYGVDIGAVSTIIRMQELTAVPQTPRYVEGVINLRGSIIPVIDLRKRFNLAEKEMTKSSRIVVVEANDILIGMIVDAVAETIRLSADLIEPPSCIISSVDSEHLRGIAKQGDRLVILLDIDIVMNGKDYETTIKAKPRISAVEAKAA